MGDKVATWVKDIEEWTGDAKLYRVTPPLDGFDYVVVSATVAMYTGPETYIFGANAGGDVTEWGELDGSYRGGMSHAEALEGAGYSIAERVES